MTIRNRLIFFALSVVWLAGVLSRGTGLCGPALRSAARLTCSWGDTLYLAGRIGIDSKTDKPPENLEKEIATSPRFPARAFVGSGPLLRGGHFEVQSIAIKQ